MIETRCTCGTLLRGKDEHAGKAAKCPSCGARVVFPAGEPEAPMPAARPEPVLREEAPQPSHRRPRDYDDEAWPRRVSYDQLRRGPVVVSGKAVTALVIGLFAVVAAALLAIPGISLALGVFTFIIPAALGLPAVLFGILALTEISQMRGRLGGTGMAASGLCAASVSLLGIALLVFLQNKYKNDRLRFDDDIAQRNVRFGPGQFGPGQFGPGQFGPGQFGPPPFAPPFGNLPPDFANPDGPDGAAQFWQAAQRIQSINNLKQIALAMHNYNDATRKMPPAIVYSPDGRPLYSWRVLLLPYLEQKALYDHFRLDEAWDSPHNIKLIDQMPTLYALPNKQSLRESYYRVFHSKGLKTPNAPFVCDAGGLKPGDLKPLVLKNALGEFKVARSARDDRALVQAFPDGTSNTFLIVEAAEPVAWTKPGDLAYEPDQPLPRLGGHMSNSFNAALADGSTQVIDTRRVLEPVLRLAIQCNDGKPMPPEFRN